MIVGIGVDILKVSRVSKKLAKRILSNEEFRIWMSRKENVEFLAGRFALKEAFFKAVGTGVREYSFKDISFLVNDLGKPYIEENEKIRDVKRQYGFEKIHLALSHDGGMVIAFVVLEK